MATHILAVFDSLDEVGDAINFLEERGVEPQNMSLAVADSGIGGRFKIETTTKAPEGAAAGALAGGGVAAVVAGLAAIGMANPLGLTLWAGGPLATVLANTGIAGAVGTLLGGLFGVNIPEHEVKALSSRVESGGVLLGVLTSDSDASRVEELVVKAGGTEVRRMWHSR